jgi:hypothetical protein
MGCCTTRMKVDEHTSIADYHALNTLPTYENVLTVYTDLNLPPVNFIQLPHKKEQMVFMIINMIRANPQLFLHALSILQDRCSQR